MSKLGEVRSLPPTDDGYERFERLDAIVECETCGRDVELWSETDGWVEGDEGAWRHDSYGPAMGECCDNVYADWWEGTFVFPGKAS